MPNRFIPIQPGTDPSQQVAMINKNFGELDAENVKKLYFDSNGVPSISLGIQSDGSTAIKVAQSGVDVTKATNSQLTFNSAQNIFKIAKSGVATFPSLAATSNFISNSIVIDTGIAADVPLIAQAWSYSSSVSYQLPILSTSSAVGIAPSGGGFIRYRYDMSAYIVSGVLKLEVFGINYINQVLPALPIKWYVLQDSVT